MSEKVPRQEASLKVGLCQIRLTTAICNLAGRTPWCRLGSDSGHRKHSHDILASAVSLQQPDSRTTKTAACHPYPWSVHIAINHRRSKLRSKSSSPSHNADAITRHHYDTKWPENHCPIYQRIKYWFELRLSLLLTCRTSGSGIDSSSMSDVGPSIRSFLFDKHGKVAYSWLRTVTPRQLKTRSTYPPIEEGTLQRGPCRERQSWVVLWHCLGRSQRMLANTGDSYDLDLMVSDLRGRLQLSHINVCYI